MVAKTNLENESGSYDVEEPFFIESNYFGPGRFSKSALVDKKGNKKLVNGQPAYLQIQFSKDDQGKEYLFKKNGKYWRDTETYFQAHKFAVGTPPYDDVAKQASPREAFNVGRDGKYKNDKVDNWEDENELTESGLIFKEHIMLEALCAKYVQNKVLEDETCSTGNLYKAEHSREDPYWGSLDTITKKDGTETYVGPGQNRLGIMQTLIADGLRKTKDIEDNDAREKALYDKVASTLKMFPPRVPPKGQYGLPTSTEEPPFKQMYMRLNPNLSVDNTTQNIELPLTPHKQSDINSLQPPPVYPSLEKPQQTDTGRFTVFPSKEGVGLEILVNGTPPTLAKGRVYRAIETIGASQISDEISIEAVIEQAQKIVNIADSVFKETPSPGKVNAVLINDAVEEALTDLLMGEDEKGVLEHFERSYGEMLKPPLPASTLEALDYHPEKINAIDAFVNRKVVFVFGSNKKGLHGGGAAAAAVEKFGAIEEESEGRHGMSYAIPTLKEPGGSLPGEQNRLPLGEIEKYAKDFIQHAKANPQEVFFVTALGSVIAGFDEEQQNKIAEYFAAAPSNCSFSEKWRIPIENKRLEISSEQGVTYTPNLLPHEINQANKDRLKASSSIQQAVTQTSSTLDLEKIPAELIKSYPSEFKEKYDVRKSGNVYKKDAPGSKPVLKDNQHSLQIMDTDEDVIKDAMALAAHRMPEGITIKIPKETPELADIYYKNAALQGLPTNILVDGKKWQPLPELEQKVKDVIVEKAIAGLEATFSDHQAAYSNALVEPKRTKAKLDFLETVYTKAIDDVAKIGELPNKPAAECQKEIDTLIKANRDMIGSVLEKSTQWPDNDKQEIWEKISKYAKDNDGKIDLSEIDRLVDEVTQKKQKTQAATVIEPLGIGASSQQDKQTAINEIVDKSINDLNKIFDQEKIIISHEEDSERSTIKLAAFSAMQDSLKNQVAVIAASAKSPLDCLDRIRVAKDEYIDARDTLQSEIKRLSEDDGNKLLDKIAKLNLDEAKIDSAMIQSFSEEIELESKKDAQTKDSGIDDTHDDDLAPPLEKKEGFKPLDLPMPNLSSISLDSEGKWSMSGENAERFKAAIEVRNTKNEGLISNCGLEEAMPQIEAEKPDIGTILVLETILEDNREIPLYKNVTGIGSIESAKNGINLNGQVAYKDSQGNAYILPEPTTNYSQPRRAKMQTVTEEQQRIMGVNLESGHILTGAGLQAGVPRGQEQHSQEILPAAQKRRSLGA